MLLESLFIIFIILIFVVMFYRAAIHEYTILQKDWQNDSVKWSDLVSERAPIVIRQVPNQWTRLWSNQRTSKFGWPIVVQEGKQKSRTSLSIWLKTKGDAKKYILNTADIASVAGLHDHASEISSHFRRPFWLPGSFAVSSLKANIISPVEGEN